MNALTFSEQGLNWAQSFSFSEDAVLLSRVKNFTIQKTVYLTMIPVALVELVFFSAIKLVKNIFYNLDATSSAALVAKIDSAKNALLGTSSKQKNAEINPQQATITGSSWSDCVTSYATKIPKSYIVGALACVIVASISIRYFNQLNNELSGLNYKLYELENKLAAYQEEHISLVAKDTILSTVTSLSDKVTKLEHKLNKSNDSLSQQAAIVSYIGDDLTKLMSPKHYMLFHFMPLMGVLLLLEVVRTCPGFR